MTTANGTGRAVVVGGSIAGLLSARVLADHYDSVLVLDRDELPREPVVRGGVPQGRHSHGLLARGREVMEELLPGLTDDLVALGAGLADVQAHSTIYVGREHLATGCSGLRGLRVSRPLLEWYIRQRVAATAGVQVVDGTSVLDLQLSPDLGTVCGVVVTGIDESGSRCLGADLVVDASGRASRTPEWLERRGYAAPPEERVRVDVNYATRRFRRDVDDVDGGLRTVICPPSRRTPRGAVAIGQEGGLCTVSVAGYHGDRPPTELPGFLAFARSACSPAVADLVEHLEPADDGVLYRFPANSRHRYEQAARFPAGLVVIGDALCCFDPVYGQGMTVAALEALELQRCLREDPTHLAVRFFERAARHIDTPWTVVVGATRRLPGATEPAPRSVVIVDRYVRALQRAAITDHVLASAFIRVVEMAAPRSSLMAPPYAARVASSTVRWHRTIPQSLTGPSSDLGQLRTTTEHDQPQKATEQ